MLWLRPKGQKYNDLQSTAQKTQDPATRILQNTVRDSCVPEWLEVPAPLMAFVV
jgi:hypothetical protein